MPIRELDMSGILESSDKEIKIREININDFKKTLKKVKPMTNKTLIKEYNDWAEEFGEI